MLDIKEGRNFGFKPGRAGAHRGSTLRSELGSASAQPGCYLGLNPGSPGVDEVGQPLS